MSFSSINIQGNIVSSEILDKIRTEEKFKHQSPEAFGLARSASLRDEIGHAWAIMRTHWQAYKKRLETLPANDTGTSLTREKLIIPLLAELGYETGKQNAQLINGKSYAISHSATNRDNFPIHIMGFNDNLDKRRESGGPRLSPHALVQEYLNNMEHLYALVTNGRQLRLLRDATRLVRMSYLEFDLERMFEEELYADFSLLYRTLHVSRMPEKIDAGPDSSIEFYHQESLASGGRIRSKLSEAVEKSIKTLANGFLAHPKNTGLTNDFKEEKLTADSYYTHQLRLIYRILFLIVLEERKLIHPDNLDEEQQRQRDIYYRYYSIERLRKLTENSVYVDSDKYDLWESLKTTFLLFEEEKFGAKIGLKPLGSGLFAPNALGNLKSQFLSNGNLISVLKSLTTFVNEQGQYIRVNYSDLDVEEFGSVYEGLLEYDPVVNKVGSVYEFSFVQGTDRSSSGSHYTPEELVKPLIKHSLDYIIADKLAEPEPDKALLTITVCDVACGSGHILLSAARRIATELASIREGAEQPSPTYYRAAIRDVIRNCIYGVDLNPLAVELCKVALWLEAHNPNEPLNFLDHHIKCGNAIVGLAHHTELENGIATEAFKTLPGDDKELAASLRKTNEIELKAKKQLTTADISKINENLRGVQKAFADFVDLPENTPDEIEAKTQAYNKMTKGAKYWQLKSLADAQVAQFFIPKTQENKNRLTTDAKYRTALNSGLQLQDQGASLEVASRKSFFHWFLEFPEVFGQGGFNCILGNPPFLGGKRISGHFGDGFLNCLKTYFEPASGGLDLVTYFFRRDFQLIKNGGFQSLISTNTIAQGDSRKGGLAVIKDKNGTINHAVRSMKWPGLAAVEVALVTIHKGLWTKDFVLDQRKVSHINTYLDDQPFLGEPFTLKNHENKSFQGSVVLGKGFVLKPEEAQILIEKDGKNKDVLFPYLNGQDLNNEIDQSASRWIINFFGWDKKKAMEYPECFSIIETLVKPERDKVKRKTYRENWWQYAERGVNLYKNISNLERVLVVAQVSKTVAFSFVPRNQVLSMMCIVFVIDDYPSFTVMQSTFHKEWVSKYGSALKNDTRYTPSDVFENYPFPNNLAQLEHAGEDYYTHRSFLMTALKLGLTKTYNQFHNQDLVFQVEPLEAKAFQKKYSKETWNLYNHLEIKKEGKISYVEAVPLILKLRELHKEMDEAVLTAYGWGFDSAQPDKGINLRHDFYEVDYLPENDRVRYTIHPDARKEVLKRLLLLNHERFEEEVQQGLHKKKDVEAYYKQKNEEVPEGLPYSDVKTKSINAKAKKKAIAESTKSANPLIAEEQVTNKPGEEVGMHSKVTVKNLATGVVKKIRIASSKTGQSDMEYETMPITEPFALAMFNRKTGSKFKHEGVQYEIIGVV